MDNELKRNGSGYYDETAYKALKNIIGGNMMKLNKGEIWEVEMSNGIPREMFVVKPLEEYVVGLLLRDTKPSESHVAIKSRAVMYAETGRMTYAYYDRIGNYIKSLPDDDVQFIVSEIVKTLDLDTVSVPVEVERESRSDEGATATIVRLEAERDAYKELCDRLLEKAVKVA